MTINVTIKKEDEGNGNNAHVAIVNKDIYGNASVAPGHIFQLETGEEKVFCLHSNQELRVYETEQELI